MPVSPGDKLGPYEIVSPIGADGIQPLTRTTGVMVSSMTRPKRRHIMHTTGAMSYDTLALVQQLLGNGFKSWMGHQAKANIRLTISA